MPRPRDPAELLDVDMDELARSGALVAARRLEAKAPEAPESDPGQDPRDGRLRHREDLGDLGAGEAQSPQRADRLDSLLRGSVVDAMRGRGSIEKARISLGEVA